MVEQLQFMAMANRFVTVVIAKLVRVDTSLISQTATSDIRQDDVLISGEHPRPFALSVDVMDA